MDISENDTSDSETRAEQLLELFSQKWNVSDSVADADVVSVHPETVKRYEHSRIKVEESVQDVEFPLSSYKKLVDEQPSIEERYSDIPKEDTVIPFIQHGQPPQDCDACNGRTKVRCDHCSGDGIETCSNCHGDGTVTCRSCGGDGSTRCDNCRGNGTVGHGDNESQCPTCNGSGGTSCERCGGARSHPCGDCGGGGTVACHNCDGEGQVTCERCEGDGKVVTALKGEIDVSHQTPTNINGDRVPKDLVPSDAGELVDVNTRVKRNPAELGEESIYHHEISTYDIPSRSIHYQFDGTEYVFYQIGNELTANTYPKSKARHLVTGLAVVTLLGLLTGTAWYFGYLPL